MYHVPCTVFNRRQKVFEDLGLRLTEYGQRIATALVILLAGIFVARVSTRFLDGVLHKTKMPENTRGFVGSVVYISIIVLTVIMALTPFEIDIAPLVVGLAIIAFIVGLALQGTLANFAAGMIILIKKPFRSGDIVEIAGEKGQVREIGTTTTVIDTPGNVKVIFPNGKVLAGEIKNYSSHKTQRINISFEIDKNIKIAEFLEKVIKILSSSDKVLQDPPFSAKVSSFSKDALGITIQAWCDSGDEEDARHDILFKIKNEMER